MMKYKYLAAVTIAMGVGLSTSVAQAASFTDLPTFTDTDFNNAKNSGLFEEDWVAEGRIGNNANNGTWEQGIFNWVNNTTFPPTSAQDNFVWTDSTLVQLSKNNPPVTYDL